MQWSHKHCVEIASSFCSTSPSGICTKLLYVRAQVDIKGKHPQAQEGIEPMDLLLQRDISDLHDKHGEPAAVSLFLPLPLFMSYVLYSDDDGLTKAQVQVRYALRFLGWFNFMDLSKG